MVEEVVRELSDIVEKAPQLDVSAHGQTPLPILPCGPRDATVCIMGRDPGAEEVRCGLPFIGQAGERLWRSVLNVHHPGVEPTWEGMLEMHGKFFLSNTVPFKPVDNKLWSAQVRRECHGTLLRLMLEGWSGREVLTLGREAFLWFSIDQPADIRREFNRFWKRADKYEASLDMNLSGRSIRLHPIPHPSLKNARFRASFAPLLESRLKQLRKDSAV